MPVAHGAVSAGTEPKAASPELEPVLGEVLWRFDAGAPVLGQAAVSARGNVYIATTEGYVHALGPDGSFRWSYTVVGPVVGSPAVNQQDTVFVGTAQKRVYAIRPNGTLLWVVRSPSSVLTDIVLDAGGLQYGGLETLYRLNWHGQVTGWVSVPGGISQGPARSPGAEAGQPLLIATRAGEVLDVRKRRAKELGRTDRGIVQPPVRAEDGSVLVLAGDRLAALTESGAERWSRVGVVAAAPNSGAGAGRTVAVTGAGELLWLAEDGSVVARAGLDCRDDDALAAPTAPPSPGPDGRVYVATGRGRVVIASKHGVERCVDVGRAALSSPVIDAERWRVVVSGRDGSVAALAMGQSTRSPHEAPR